MFYFYSVFLCSICHIEIMWAGCSTLREEKFKLLKFKFKKCLNQLKCTNTFNLYTLYLILLIDIRYIYNIFRFIISECNIKIIVV